MSAGSRRAIALGVLLLGFGCVFLYFYPNYFSPLAMAGRRTGYDPATYVAVVTLQHRAEVGKHLNESDMGRLLQLSDDVNPFIRVKALTALHQTRGTKQAESAARIARRKLTDDHPLVRSYALNALSRLMAPDAIQTARQMLSDADASVREEARRVIGSRAK